MSLTNYSCTNRITKQVFDEYNNIILNTTRELNDHIGQVDDRLNNLCLQDITISNEKGGGIGTVVEREVSNQPVPSCFLTDI